MPVNESKSNRSQYSESAVLDGIKSSVINERPMTKTPTVTIIALIQIGFALPCISAAQARPQHTFTHRGNFTVHLLADGIEGLPFEKTQQISVSGSFDSTFDPHQIFRREK
jgi:hypothetical protein